jgi:hypothetical protein
MFGKQDLEKHARLQNEPTDNFFNKNGHPNIPITNTGADGTFKAVKEKK